MHMRQQREHNREMQRYHSAGDFSRQDDEQRSKVYYNYPLDAFNHPFKRALSSQNQNDEARHMDWQPWPVVQTTHTYSRDLSGNPYSYTEPHAMGRRREDNYLQNRDSHFSADRYDTDLRYERNAHQYHMVHSESFPETFRGAELGPQFASYAAPVIYDHNFQDRPVNDRRIVRNHFNPSGLPAGHHECTSDRFSTHPQESFNSEGHGNPIPIISHPPPGQDMHGFAEQNESSDQKQQTKRGKRRTAWIVITRIIASIFIVMNTILDWLQYYEIENPIQKAKDAFKNIKPIDCEYANDIAQLFMYFTIVGTVLTILQLINVIYQIYCELYFQKQDADESDSVNSSVENLNLRTSRTETNNNEQDKSKCYKLAKWIHSIAGKKIVDGRTEVVLTLLFEDFPQAILIYYYYGSPACVFLCSGSEKKTVKLMKAIGNGLVSSLKNTWRYFTSTMFCEESGTRCECGCDEFTRLFVHAVVVAKEETVVCTNGNCDVLENSVNVTC